ncbi:YfiR family protein [Rugamonas apoptosis]|uniref:YfiR family protein n=1 Tax=Rugamonas apoptosis TaxID=2758570 RepID=A0A7W2IMK9_9BURK|nr:YfiR family protein [Rugamonas apoptosis]MBA5689793.1 YfiR family protein [Rugamonas apoptosis]
MTLLNGFDTGATPGACAGASARARRRLLLAALGVAWLVPAVAQSPAGALERQVKAAYLYKFAGFVEWPDGSFARPDSPLVIGVAGADALADQLELTVAGRNAGGHPLQVKRVRKGEPLAGVHILFMGAMDKAQAQDLLAASQSQSVLTVSDSEEAHALGSIIHFVIADDKLRFEVALKQALAARIKISARMLSAAYRVQGAI